MNYGVSTNVAHRVNKRNRLNIGTMFSETEFSRIGPGVTPSTFLEGNLDWTHRLNSLVDTHLIASVGWQHIDSQTVLPAIIGDPIPPPIPETDSLIYKITFGTDAKLTKRLSVKANAGASIIEQTVNNSAILGGGSRTVTSVGFIGDLSMLYQPMRDLTFELSAQQTVAPDNLGDLRETRKFNGSTVYKINEDTSFILDSAFTLSTGTSGQGSSRKTLSITPQFVHRIVRHWNAVLGYQWVMAGTWFKIPRFQHRLRDVVTFWNSASIGFPR